MKKIVISLLLLLVFANSDNNDSNKVKWKLNSVKKIYTINYDKNTTCLVRHFKVYKAPKWIAKIEVRNGKTVYFSSPKSMFEFYHRPAKWFDVGVKSENDFAKIVVTDYDTLKAIDARKAFYVYGSRAISPAGDDLPAFKTKEEAETFVKKYSGSRIMKFNEISDALIRLLNGRI